tara:strand:- start:538 stop:828 length:291 start_codon:yes stop_codon:yes gene_type:complete
MAKEETKTAEAQTAQPTANASEVDPNALSLGDLKNLTTIIDVASSRGAFRANEMASIGLMYNKLQSFLQKTAPANPAQQPVAGAVVPPTPDATEGK